MATVTKGRTFVSGETVTPTKLNELVDNATVTSIVDADVSASAAIALSKLATGALPAAITVANANIVSGVDASKLTTGTLPADRIGSDAITTARINNAAVTAAKLDGAQTGLAPIYGCRAWVNFDGNTGATVDGEFRCTIRSSGNVSKVVRSTAGTFVIHFATALPNNDYAVCGNTNQAVLGNRSSGWNIRGTDDSLMTTTTVTIDVGSVSSGGPGNNTVVSVCIFG